MRRTIAAAGAAALILAGTTARADMLTVVPGAGNGQMQPYMVPGRPGSVVVVEPLRDDAWEAYRLRSRAREHQEQMDRIEQHLDEMEMEGDDGDD